MRLNIGGGYQRIEGFQNVDLCDAADIKHDLRLPLPLEDKSVEEIIAIHVIESFYKWEFPAIIKDWYRVLNGKLTIEFTVLSNTIDLYLHGWNDTEKLSGRWGLYGRQDEKVDPIVLHHYVYEKEELKKILEDTGFRDITFDEVNINHKRGRDVRVICHT